MLFNTNIIINIIVKYHKFICRYEFIITREDSHEEKNVNIYFWTKLTWSDIYRKIKIAS